MSSGTWGCSGGGGGGGVGLVIDQLVIEVVTGCSGTAIDSKTNQAKLLTALCKSEAIVFQSVDDILMLPLQRMLND